MANVLKLLRSLTMGNRPTTGHVYGEAYVNLADKQFGMLDSTNTPQDLIGVPFFSTATAYASGNPVNYNGSLYIAKVPVSAGAWNAAQWLLVGSAAIISDTVPTSPTPGELWWDSVGGQLYIYFNDGTSSQWVIANNMMGAYVPISGGTMTGTLTLNANPVNPLDAVPKQYVDNGVTNGSNAAAGQVGEFLTASGTSVAIPINGAANITTLSLPAGDWDVSGFVICNQNTPAVTNAAHVWISTTSATFPGAGSTGLSSAACSTAVNPQIPIGPTRYSVTAPTTLYLSAQINGSAGTGTGTIRARRMR
jgi:hypothetical protein